MIGYPVLTVSYTMEALDKLINKSDKVRVSNFYHDPTRGIVTFVFTQIAPDEFYDKFDQFEGQELQSYGVVVAEDVPDNLVSVEQILDSES